MLGPATTTTTTQDCLAPAPTQHPPPRHEPTMAQLDFGAMGHLPGGLCEACRLCMTLPAIGVPVLGTRLSACCTISTQARQRPSPFLSVLPRNRGPGSPGLQGESAGVPAHLGPLPLSISLPCCVTLGEGGSHSEPSKPGLKRRRGKNGASKLCP